MASKIVQYIYDIRLKQSPRSLSGLLKIRIIDLLFNRFKKQNPLIETYVGRFKLKLPFAHQLPFIVKLDPHYSTNLARIARLVQEKYSDLKFIDIGANVGDSVALLRTEATFPILCIEGDDYFFSILQTNISKFSDVYLAKNYVGESTSEANVVSIELGGTAHLGQSGTEQGHIIYLKKLSSILEDYTLFQQSKMLKVDTDGFDNKILRGSVDFIMGAKPVIFFEYDPFFLSQQDDDGLSIFNTLAAIGYKSLLIYENNGELMLSTDLDNSKILEDVTHFYTGRKGLRYCDICAFHREDNDLFDKVKKSEMQFFEQSRR